MLTGKNSLRAGSCMQMRKWVRNVTLTTRARYGFGRVGRTVILELQPHLLSRCSTSRMPSQMLDQSHALHWLRAQLQKKPVQGTRLVQHLRTQPRKIRLPAEGGLVFASLPQLSDLYL